MNFGIIYAGGALAIEAELVPWTVEDLRDAIATCFDGFRGTCGRPEDLGKKAIRVFKDALAAAELGHRADLRTLNQPPKIGVRTGPRADRIVVIRSSAFDRKRRYQATALRCCFVE